MLKGVKEFFDIQIKNIGNKKARAFFFDSCFLICKGFWLIFFNR